MNKLPVDKRVQIISLLVEGSTLWATSQLANVSINTVIKLLVEVGRACKKFHDEVVMFVGSQCIRCNVIWSFVYNKRRNVSTGVKEMSMDIWTWTCIDTDTQLIICWYVGNRNEEGARLFMNDVANRIKGKISQIGKDDLHECQSTVLDAFGGQDNFAQMIKVYSDGGNAVIVESKYSSPDSVAIKRSVGFGTLDRQQVFADPLEPQNLRVRMQRFAPLTNAFYKKVENHAYAVALHFVYYNFVKQHKSLRITPAMAAGLTKRFMSIEDMVNLTETNKGKKGSN